MNHLGVALLLSLLPRLDVFPGSAEGWTARGTERTEVVVLQELIDDLRSRLQIAEQVQVALAEHNPLVMSVETLSGRTGTSGFIHTTRTYRPSAWRMTSPCA